LSRRGTDLSRLGWLLKLEFGLVLGLGLGLELGLEGKRLRFLVEPRSLIRFLLVFVTEVITTGIVRFYLAYIIVQSLLDRR
jgi:hypothetical protein